ncbi:alpha/beta fold hydrolase [Streptomyces avicenniae]|uniref:alpha/beta fold hydrolase n=1 Tax=Streptomyces avicenniae TaxID=500153 RepID=UPI000A43B219|nr:alpha/beta fold hydrolase [Streptomyces avicenniae]
MTPVTGTLAVPGARLYHETRGAGPPLLLIAGGNSDAAVFTGLADALADRYRVLSYDARGYSRSPLDGPPCDQFIETHAEDAHRLLTHLAPSGGPVRVFGSCSGGLVAMALAARYPEAVGPLVVHEPPAMLLLPDAAEHLALFDEVHALSVREGIPAAMRRLSVIFGGRPAPVLPEERDNTAFFLAHVVRPFARHRPDLGALARTRRRVAVAGGHTSRGQTVHRPAVVLAQRLGRDLALFPGGHVGYAKHPAAFADRLAEVLSGLEDGRPSSAESPGTVGTDPVRDGAASA